MLKLLQFFVGSSLKTIVYRVMAALGLGIVSYTGSQVVITEMVDLFVDYANDMPTQYLSVIGYLYIDRAFSLIVSAITVAIGIKGASKAISVRSS